MVVNFEVVMGIHGLMVVVFVLIVGLSALVLDFIDPLFWPTVWGGWRVYFESTCEQTILVP